jgi:hypothetical protein
VRGGGAALLLPALTALIYGGLMTVLSAALRSGDAMVALLFFLPTLLPPSLLEILAGVIGRTAGQVLLLVLPPQTTALTDVYQGLLTGSVAPGAVAFVVGYAAVWLIAGGLLVQLREMP